ncbi:hypothetical protein FACS1894189_7670 [Planctomycetales bacterium]|nr:hypothetical protein FACS1894189_7670 [Planctomycetales bacterium]
MVYSVQEQFEKDQAKAAKRKTNAEAKKAAAAAEERAAQTMRRNARKTAVKNAGKAGLVKGTAIGGLTVGGGALAWNQIANKMNQNGNV